MQLPALAVNPPNFRGVMQQVAAQKFNDARLTHLQAQGQRADRRLDFEIYQYSDEQAQRAQIMGARRDFQSGDTETRDSAEDILRVFDPDYVNDYEEGLRKATDHTLKLENRQVSEIASVAGYFLRKDQETPDSPLAAMGMGGSNINEEWAEMRADLPPEIAARVPENFNRAFVVRQSLRALYQAEGIAAEQERRAANKGPAAPKQRTVDLPGGQQQQQEWVNGDWVSVGEPVARWTPKQAGKTAAPKLDWQYLPGGKMQRRVWRDEEWHNVGEPVNRWQPKEGGSLTAAQKSNNTAIARSRKEVKAALKKYRDDPAQLIAAAWGTDPIMRLMGGRDPILVGSIKKALSRRTGDDGGYEAFREIFLSVSPPPEPDVAAEPGDTDSGNFLDDWMSGIADMFGSDEPAAAEAASGKPASTQNGAPAELPVTRDGKIDVASLKVGTIYDVRSEGGGTERLLWNGTEFEPLGVKPPPVRTRRSSAQ